MRCSYLGRAPSLLGVLCLLSVLGVCLCQDASGVESRLTQMEKEIAVLRESLRREAHGAAVAPAHTRGHAAGHLLYPPPYGTEAVHNLTVFKTNMLSNLAKYFDEDGPKPSDNFDEHYGPFQPFISCPPGRALSRFGGSGDGGKILCDLSTLTDPCIVYSLGSNGDFSFEQAVLASTPCKVHTFDCTYAGSSIDPRHTYHKTCIGKGGPDFKMWADIVHELGHNQVDLFKVDIEGYEVDVVPYLLPNSILPKQISIELHSAPQLPFGPANHLHSTPVTALFFMHLASLGYGVVSSEMNPLSTAYCCAEYTFLRVLEV